MQSITCVCLEAITHLLHFLCWRLLHRATSPLPSTEVRLTRPHNPPRIRIRMKTRQARRKVTASTKKVSRGGVRRIYDAHQKRKAIKEGAKEPRRESSGRRRTTRGRTVLEAYDLSHHLRTAVWRAHYESGLRIRFSPSFSRRSTQKVIHCSSCFKLESLSDGD